MNAKFLSTFLLAAGSLPLIVASPPAAATLSGGTQITRYAGNACHPVDAQGMAQAKIDNNGRIFNTSPDHVLAVNCTVVRDQFAGKNANVTVYAIDQKQKLGALLTCRFSMDNPATGQVNSQSLFGTTEVVSSPTQAQAIKSAALSVINHATLHCFIPQAAPDGSKQSGIAGYDFTEFQ